MTGWRCGWSVASPEISAVLTKVKSFTDTGAFMAVQAAGVAALESYDAFVPRNVATFKSRRDAAVEAFTARHSTAVRQSSTSRTFRASDHSRRGVGWPASVQRFAVHTSRGVTVATVLAAAALAHARKQATVKEAA